MNESESGNSGNPSESIQSYMIGIESERKGKWQHFDEILSHRSGLYSLRNYSFASSFSNSVSFKRSSSEKSSLF